VFSNTDGCSGYTVTWSADGINTNDGLTRTIGMLLLDYIRMALEISRARISAARIEAAAFIAAALSNITAKDSFESNPLLCASSSIQLLDTEMTIFPC